MSNGDEILVDSWEQIDELELSTQLNQLKQELTNNPQDDTNTATLDTTMPFQNGRLPGGLMMVMRSADEEYGANYTQSNKPTVKILRRPTQQNANDSKLNDNRPKQPIKTLQQREQEYAEARLRILGSAKNPEDELEANLSKIVMKSSSENLPQSSNYNQGGTTVAPVTAATTSSLNDILTSPPLSLFSYNMINNGQEFVTGQENKPQDNNNIHVIRMPRGPDGTPGFNFRR